ncbi:MAG: putative glycoside hydrolase [Candidatus Liptonbacteria bacterium]|nr:putative glycoside hydrolase [Candidatus Liptonbacteria bacterium]
MRRAIIFTIPVLVLVLAIAIFPRKVNIEPAGKAGQAQVAEVLGGAEPVVPPDSQPPATNPPLVTAVSPKNYSDIGPQPQLPNPPGIAKAIYLTGWSAGSSKKVDETIALIKRTELNAVIIDIKDYSGLVSYAMDIPLVKESGAMGEIRITRPNEVIKKFHDAGIYVIGRITVFQDPILAKLKPGWALQRKDTGKTWTDSKGLAWMDPAGQGTWDYIISIARDGIARGFDEINFDYIRFASDGTLGNISYPFWDQKSSRSKVIAKFFVYLREKMDSTGSPQVGRPKISADLFGLATVNKDDLGIGQVIEDAYKNFDFVAPMVYPSHYAPGFIGFQKPGEHPYEVMKYSLDRANERWNALVHPKSTSTIPIPPEKLGKLRPWIQDFNLGATYTASMVRKEFQAVYDSLINGTTTGAYAGWLIWDASNTYTEGALEKKQ